MVHITQPCSQDWQFSVCSTKPIIKCLQPGGDSLLHVTIYCMSLSNQVLLRGSKQMDMTGCTVRIAVCNLPAIVLRPVHSMWPSDFVSPSSHSEAPGSPFAKDADMKQAVTSRVDSFDTSFFYGRIQALVLWSNQQVNVNAVYTEVWCVPSATHVPSTSTSECV